MAAAAGNDDEEEDDGGTALELDEGVEVDEKACGGGTIPIAEIS